MAGHIQDRWYKTERGPDGTTRRVRTDRYGKGKRYRARYVGPDGTEKSRSFPDRQKRLAERWLAEIEADMSRGQYIDPKAGRITFRQYAEKWLTSQTTDPNTRASVETQIQRHAIPYLGSRPMESFQPSHIREWLSDLEKVIPAASYRHVVFGNVSAIFTAAIDDGIRVKNPCRSRSVKAPGRLPSRVKPWSIQRVREVRVALPERFRAVVDVGAGCGLRQGEIFGLPFEEIDFAAGWLHVACQVKVIGGRLVFAPPKRGKERDVPLSNKVAAALREHTQRFPPTEVTLPWIRPDGPPVTKRLVFSRGTGGPVRRTDFNTHVWKPALVSAGVIPAPEAGKRHQPSRENGMHALRHFYASVLLAAGENIKVLSTYLGHGDPGFTLRVYTHLMPSSDGRARQAMDQIYEQLDEHPDGP